MSRDTGHRTEAAAELARLVEEQAALRRVATLVAKADLPEKVFAMVAEETGRLLGGVECTLLRNERDGAATNVGTWGERISAVFPLRARFFPDGDGVAATVLGTGRPYRIDDYSAISDPLARSARDRGIESSVGCPIVVLGAIWGAILVGTTGAEPFPPETETRLAQFAELIAIAVANAQSRETVAELAKEQAALRRVATLVAEGGNAQDIFDAVCRETCQLLDATAVTLSHYTPDGLNVTMAGWSVNGRDLPTGTRLPIERDTVGDAIVRTRAPARVDSWDDSPSEMARLVRERGVRSSLGAPIVVEGHLWGALNVGTALEEPLPAGTEFRLARFTELIATAISNTATRSELIASRARIVAAGDEARRRIERNLHDGTQQRLIAIGLDIQRVRATIPEDQREAHLGLERVVEDLQSVLEDIRVLSRGLHPPLLARRGLRSALRVLARDSAIPVELEIDLPERPTIPLETALYYVVSEALTNAIKHSQASLISITIEADKAREPFEVRLEWRKGGATLRATIADDGVGGANPSTGSGLTGLADRVDALGGRFALDTPSGGGTRISIELPLEIR
jgi:signal transduction histidine kinase